MSYLVYLPWLGYSDWCTWKWSIDISFDLDLELAVGVSRTLTKSSRFLQWNVRHYCILQRVSTAISTPKLETRLKQCSDIQYSNYKARKNRIRSWNIFLSGRFWGYVAITSRYKINALTNFISAYRGHPLSSLIAPRTSEHFCSDIHSINERSIARFVMFFYVHIYVATHMNYLPMCRGITIESVALSRFDYREYLSPFVLSLFNETFYHSNVILVSTLFILTLFYIWNLIFYIIYIEYNFIYINNNFYIIYIFYNIYVHVCVVKIIVKQKNMV